MIALRMIRCRTVNLSTAERLDPPEPRENASMSTRNMQIAALALSAAVTTMALTPALEEKFGV